LGTVVVVIVALAVPQHALSRYCASVLPVGRPEMAAISKLA
jgi:hypothetical protein